MAQFYGTLQGARGMATRLGSAGSGIETQARGWSVGVRVRGIVEDGRDTFYVDATRGSHDPSTAARIAKVTIDEDGSVLVERLA